jgi:hypothetical protein
MHCCTYISNQGRGNTIQVKILDQCIGNPKEGRSNTPKNMSHPSQSRTRGRGGTLYNNLGQKCLCITHLRPNVVVWLQERCAPTTMCIHVTCLSWKCEPAKDKMNTTSGWPREYEEVPRIWDTRLLISNMSILLWSNPWVFVNKLICVLEALAECPCSYPESVSDLIFIVIHYYCLIICLRGMILQPHLSPVLIWRELWVHIPITNGSPISRTDLLLYAFQSVGKIKVMELTDSGVKNCYCYCYYRL